MTSFIQYTGRQSDRLVREIAQRSVTATMRRLAADTADMSVAELLGYVRARARWAVCAEVRRAVTDRRVRAADAGAVIAAAVELVAHRVVHDLCLPPTVALPMPHVPRRAAA